MLRTAFGVRGVHVGESNMNHYTKAVIKGGHKTVIRGVIYYVRTMLSTRKIGGKFRIVQQRVRG